MNQSLAYSLTLTILLVNRRPLLTNRAADLTAAFQVRLDVGCAAGLLARADLSAVDDSDFDRRLADHARLHRSIPRRAA